MIDLHTHILYGVDDGAKKIEDTIKLLNEAERAGFDKIIFTSHYMEGYFTVPYSEREEIFSKIEEAKQSNTDLYIGNEIFLTDNIMNLLEQKEAITLNHSRYVLFELPFNIKPLYLNDMIYEIKRHDLVPIMAHPERYAYFYKTPEIYEEFVDDGVLLQLNYGSFGGQYGKHAKLMAEKLLKSNLVYFLGTDVHRPNTLYPQIPGIIEELNNLVGKDKVYQLTTINPSYVLEDKEIEIENFSHIKWNFMEKIKMGK